MNEWQIGPPPTRTGSDTFPAKCQRINILGFGGHAVSVKITQLCHFIRKAAIG